MAKIVRLTESDLTRIVRRVIKEQTEKPTNEWCHSHMGWVLDEQFGTFPEFYFKGGNQSTGGEERSGVGNYEYNIKGTKFRLDLEITEFHRHDWDHEECQNKDFNDRCQAYTSRGKFMFLFDELKNSKDSIVKKFGNEYLKFLKTIYGNDLMTGYSNDFYIEFPCDKFDIQFNKLLKVLDFFSKNGAKRIS
jgi:hypothetical protein